MRLFTQLKNAIIEKFSGFPGGAYRKTVKGSIIYNEAAGVDKPFVSDGVEFREVMQRERLSGATGETEEPILPGEGGTGIVDYSAFTQGDVLVLNAGLNGFDVLPQSGLGSTSFAVLWDQKATLVDGGDFVSGAFRTRDLNQESDPDGIVTLAANQFTLGAGTYYISALVPAFDTETHQAKLRNISDSTDDLVGTSNSNASTYDSFNFSRIVGIITIAASKTFEIQHECAITRLTNGFGLNTGFANVNIYTILSIMKIG